MRGLALVLLLLVAVPGCLDALTGRDMVRPTDYLRDGTYKTWVIEVDHAPGQRPSQQWLDALESRLNEVARKDAIQIVVDDELPSGSEWTDSEIADLERQHKDRETGGDTVVTWVAYLDGRYQQQNVLGVAYNWDRVVVFSERIREGCLVAVVCTGNAAQTAVLVHEFGHVLGLVDRGVPMVHPHSDGSRHSNNRNSVMYAATETTDVFGFSNIPTTFDSNDKLDLCAAGGKGSC